MILILLFCFGEFGLVFFFPNSHILLTKPEEINEYNYDGMCTIASSREGKLYLSLYKEISSYCDYK